MLVFAFWACGAGPTCESQSKSRDKAVPLWSQRLLAPDDRKVTLKTPSFHGREPTGVAFTDNGRLIAYRQDWTGKLSSRTSPDISSSFRLHAIVFDAVSGKEILVKDWGVRAHNSFIGVTDGGILVRTGPEVKFYSRDLSELQHLVLSEADTSIISISATGRTVLLNQYDRKESHFEIRDGSTFELKKSWSEAPPLRHLYSISEVAIAAADSDQKRIVLSDFGSGRWKALDGSFKAGCIYSPALLSDKLLASEVCGKFVILSTEGATLLEDSPEKDESEGEQIEASRYGQVVATSLVRRKGGGFFDTDIRRVNDRIAVYDLSRKRRVLTVEVLPLPKKPCDFALSPDGTKLAVLNDGVVSVYAVPIN